VSYSKRHYRLIGNGEPDTNAQVEERVRARAACDQAHRETLEKFGTITAENADEAIAWQEARMRELKGIK